MLTEQDKKKWTQKKILEYFKELWVKYHPNWSIFQLSSLTLIQAAGGVYDFRNFEQV